MARAMEARAEDEAKTHRPSNASALTIQGLSVRMDRSVDQAKLCHNNIAIICAGRGSHAAELKCAVCGAHRGWLSKSTFDFLSETVRCFGVSTEPFVIHDATHTQGNQHMHIDTLYPNKWLKAADLCSKAVTVTIDNVKVMEVGTEREKRPVCNFVGKEKALILNKTNTRAIGDLYGSETDAWHGQKIVLYPTTTQYGDRDMAAIRVKPPKDFVRPVAAEEAAEEEAEPSPKHDEMDDEIPF